MSKKEENMKKPRCIPQNLSMSESAPVCQHWSYAGAVGIAAMLDPLFFLSAHDRLCPGDTIRIVQMKDSNIHARDNEVLAFAEVTITKVGKVSIAMTLDRLVIMGEEDTKENGKTEVGGTGEGADPKAILVINETIEAMQQAIKCLQDEGSGLTDDDIKERIQTLLKDGVFVDMQSNLSQLSEAVLELQEGTALAATVQEPGLDHLEGQDVVPVPYHKWNPGKGEHQAVVGEGEEVEVLFSHKDKAKVMQFLDKK